MSRPLLLRAGPEESKVAHPLGARLRRNGQLAARRESHNADSPWMDAPFPGSAPHQTDGPLRVLERASGWFLFGFTGAARHAVLEDDAGHANRVQPFSDFLTFELPV